MTCEHKYQSLASTGVHWQCRDCGFLTPFTHEELVRIRGESWMRANGYLPLMSDIEVEEMICLLKKSIQDANVVGTVAQEKFFKDFAQRLLDEYLILKDIVEQ